LQRGILHSQDIEAGHASEALSPPALTNSMGTRARRLHRERAQSSKEEHEPQTVVVPAAAFREFAAGLKKRAEG
jgi:hypothetical protein